MKFIYTYRSSDGQRHTAEIEAESRDAAFVRVRTELGIKPIKVVATEGESGAGRAANVSAAPRGGVWRLVAAAVLLAAVFGGVVWWMQRPNRESQTANGEPPAASQGQPITVATPQGPVTLSVAPPLPRQAIPGDRRKIEEAVAQVRDPPVFRFAAERWLARFAEPGRKPPATGDTPVAPDAAKMAAPHAGDSPAAPHAGDSPAAPHAGDSPAAPHAGDSPAGAVALVATDGRDGSPSRPSPADFETALREPIRLASTDFTAVVDLKRIVTGMKREMRADIAGGGTVEGYLAELEKRQRLEISYRDNAERRLNDMLNGQDARSPSATGGTPVVPDAAKMAAPHVGGTPVSGQDARSRSGQSPLKAAYAYWLKANAQLQAMGIYPLALPDALRSYQMSLDIEESGSGTRSANWSQIATGRECSFLKNQNFPSCAIRQDMQ